MRYFGKRSVSSVLGLCVSVAWYLCIVVIALSACELAFIGLFDHKVVLDYLKGNHTGALMGGTSSFSTGITLSAGGIRATWPMTTMNDTRPLVWEIAAFLLRCAFWLAIIYQLRKIFANLSSGTVFGEGDARRVRTIGLIVLAGILVNGVAYMAAAMRVVKGLKLEGASLGASFTVDPAELFLGIVLIVLGEIFRCGSAMKAEQDLTV
jgi:hypothetical protein